MVIIHVPPVLLNHSNAYCFDPSHFLCHYGHKLQNHIVVHAQRGRLIRLSASYRDPKHSVWTKFIQIQITGLIHLVFNERALLAIAIRSWSIFLSLVLSYLLSSSMEFHCAVWTFLTLSILSIEITPPGSRANHTSCV